MKKWIILNKKGRKCKNDDDIIKILLQNRGLQVKVEINDFLNPQIRELVFQNTNVSQKELKKALFRIKKALKNKESIVVYTDYDADGLCSGAILWETLFELGGRVMPYVPKRHEEGYGLSKKGIDSIKRNYDVNLIITVDHGISASREIEYAKKKGIDCIVVDHHLTGKKKPTAFAIIHTTELAASGLTFLFSKFIKENLTAKARQKQSDQYQDLDLAAIGTIADLVPLKGLNRTIVKFGLQKINSTKRIGLNALMKESGLNKGEIGTYEVGHILAPRINALGRLMHALDALRLLCTKDVSRANNLAKTLGIVNKERQTKTQEAISLAYDLIDSEIQYSAITGKPKKILIISHKDFPQGVIGLVAGRIVDRYFRPAIVISKGEIISKASARSINGFNIVETIRSASRYLLDVGGHPMAAGFTIETDKITSLSKFLEGEAERILTQGMLTKFLKIDMELNLMFVNMDLYRKLQNLAPFGINNPEPLFLSRNLQIIRAQKIGKERNHLKLYIKNAESNENNPTISNYYANGQALTFQAIGFGMGNFVDSIGFDSRVDIVFTVEKDHWKEDSLQLKIKDVKLSD